MDNLPIFRALCAYISIACKTPATVYSNGLFKPNCIIIKDMILAR